MLKVIVQQENNKGADVAEKDGNQLAAKMLFLLCGYTNRADSGHLMDEFKL